MKRLLLALASTAAGLAALLSFKTHTPADGPAAAGTPAQGTTSSSAGSSTDGTGQAAGSGTAGAAPASPAARGGKGGAAATRTVTGEVADTQHGPMQVQVGLRGTKITAARVLRRTNDGPESVQIDADAIPKLNRETLAVQSARIDAVSGASSTSAGYIESLHSALRKASA
jgi:uncharacterized protein with FMN-binding domain